MAKKKNAVAELVPIGYANAIPRKRLAAAAGLEDRMMRGMLERAFVDGEIICNLQDGQGYFRVAEPAEAEMLDKIAVLQMYRQEKSRMIATKKKLKIMQEWLRAAGCLPQKECKSSAKSEEEKK